MAELKHTSTGSASCGTAREDASSPSSSSSPGTSGGTKSVWKGNINEINYKFLKIWTLFYIYKGRNLVEFMKLLTMFHITAYTYLIEAMDAP